MADSRGLTVIPKQLQSKAWIRLSKLICGFVVPIGFAHTEVCSKAQPFISIVDSSFDRS